MNTHQPPHNLTSTPHLSLPVAPLVYAELAQNVYFPKDDNLPPGFSLFEKCPEEYRWWGYFGKSYYTVDEETQTINFVIAHRGTDNVDGIIEDLELWLDYIIPAQYRESAYPFMQMTIQNFKEYAAQTYPNYQINFDVTGHSLGATLAEKTMLDPRLSDLNLKGVLLENPGLPPAQLPTDLQHLSDVADRIMLINTRPDAVNTAYPTPSNHQYHLNIDNAHYPLFLDLPLPFIPNVFYYSWMYTFGVAHPIAGIVNALASGLMLVPTLSWPYGLEAGFESYKNLSQNGNYWDGYINYLWQDNGIESIVLQYFFNDNYEYFQNFYKDWFLNNGMREVSVAEQQFMLQSLFRKDPQWLWARLPVEWQQGFQNNPNQFFNWLYTWQQQIINQLSTPVTHPIMQTVLSNTKELIKHHIQYNHDARNNVVLQALFEFYHYVNERNNALGPLDGYAETACIEHGIGIICEKYHLSREQLFAQSSRPKVNNPPPYNPELFSAVHRQASDTEFATLYKNVILRFLNDRIINLPVYDEQGRVLIKRQELIKQYNQINTAEYSEAQLRDKVLAIREIVKEHRDTTGIKGFFNQFRDTASLTEFNKIFDKNGNLKISNNPYLISYKSKR